MRKLITLPLPLPSIAPKAGTRDAGRSAFISELQICAAISVAGSLVLAAFVVLTLRRVKPQAA